MKLSIVILVCVFLYGVVSESAEEKPNPNPLRQIVRDVVSKLANPEIETAVEIIKLLKSESSTSMSEIHERTGFAKVNVVNDYSKGTIKSDRIDQLIQLWLNHKIFKFVEPTHQNILAESIEEYTLQIPEDSYNSKRFELSFNNGQGILFILMIQFEPHPTIENAVRWEKSLLQSSFEPAPPYVIVTNSRCNVFSCKRSDEIVYLPAMLTDSHIRSVIDLNINIISSSLVQV